MEWTWLTFPLLITVASTLIYVSVYSLKGEEQKANKLDLVDVDLQTGHVDGHSWFAVYSPRIQSYTLGLQPSEAWGKKERGEPGSTLTWYGKIKGGPQSLFRRSYDYAERAEGVERVPIQVWSTRLFQARWTVNSATGQVLASTLEHPPADPDGIIGKLTWNLADAELQDAQLIYRGQLYPLGNLQPGVAQRVSTKERTSPITQWVQNTIPEWSVAAGRRNQQVNRSRLEPGQFRLWPLTFVDLFEPNLGPARLVGLRELDQSWRIAAENRDEAIVVGRLASQTGAGRSINPRPDNPTRIWQGKLPGDGELPELPGTLHQESYIRLFIPIPRLNPAVASK